MNQWLRRGPLIVVAPLLFPAWLLAYTVEPQLLVLGPSGGDSSAFLRVVNRSLRPAAVEVVVNQYSRDADGRGILGPEAEDEFIVYPAQMILMPGDEANVQVRWVGAPALEAEQAFSLTTREVLIPGARRPLPAPSSDGVRLDIKVLMNYDVRLYVKPRGARPSVKVEQAVVQPQSEAGRQLLQLTLANQGTAHHPLRDMSLVLVPLDAAGVPLRRTAVTLAARDVPGMNAALLAGGRRRLSIPWPADLPQGPVRVVLSD